MKVFADKLETSFFKTDNHIKGLHQIEIKSIEDFVFRYSLDPTILLEAKAWMVVRFDELVPGNPSIDCSDEPELHGECLDIDFIANVQLLDILAEITNFVDIDGSFLEGVKESGVFIKMTESWVNDDEDHMWTISAYNDPRQLCIIINGDGTLTVLRN